MSDITISLTNQVSLNDLAGQIADECNIEDIIKFVKELDLCVGDMDFTDQMYTYFKEEHEYDPDKEE